MNEQLSKTGLFHLLVVYTVWSTTYLGMRIGVNPDNGFPPFIFGALRMLLPHLFCLVWADCKKFAEADAK